MLALSQGRFEAIRVHDNRNEEYCSYLGPLPSVLNLIIEVSSIKFTVGRKETLSLEYPVSSQHRNDSLVGYFRQSISKVTKEVFILKNGSQRPEIRKEHSLRWDVLIGQGSGPSSYHSGVNHSEWFLQESAYSSSPTDEDGCLLSCASDQISKQLW